MRHEHLVVTVEAGLKDRIDDDLDSGESLESWVADAIERKLEESEPRDPRRAGGEASAPEPGTADRERGANSGTRNDDEGGDDGRDGRGNGSDNWFDRQSDDGFDDYDEGFEYVDDCSI